MKKKFIAYFLISLLFFGLIDKPLEIFAQEAGETPKPEKFQIAVDKETIVKGYTAVFFNDSLKLSLTPGTLSEATVVMAEEIKSESLAVPWNLNILSPIYQFEFANKAAYDNHHPFYIQFSYARSSSNYKQVFFYDKNFSAWRPLPTKDYPAEKFVRSQIHLPFARLAVFEYPGILTAGSASWYQYKKGNFAASPDFPKGSRLRVFSGNKFVDVEINDYGPSRRLHPDRVVDLSKEAFARLASLKSGVIEVKVEPLFIAPEKGKVLGAEENFSSEPVTAAKAAVVVDEASGEVIWQKEGDKQLPLASLTKLVAVKTFLDTRPSLDQKATYSQKDEEYNYLYCRKGESALLKVKDGDVLTVENLIYAALVGSANNAVETLVRVSGLGRDEFIKKMNENVISWGAVNTKFIEPTGLSPANVSSAKDYAIITKEVYANPIVQKASVIPEYKFKTINSGQAHNLKNTNLLVRFSDLEITGSKTGYLNEAGYCLMLRAKTASGGQIIAVTFGLKDRLDSFFETEKLLRYGIKKGEQEI